MVTKELHQECDRIWQPTVSRTGPAPDLFTKHRLSFDFMSLILTKLRAKSLLQLKGGWQSSSSGDVIPLAPHFGAQRQKSLSKRLLYCCGWRSRIFKRPTKKIQQWVVRIESPVVWAFREIWQAGASQSMSEAVTSTEAGTRELPLREQTLARNLCETGPKPGTSMRTGLSQQPSLEKAWASDLHRSRYKRVTT